jgi:AcrR family transcriptional regulator
MEKTSAEPASDCEVRDPRVRRTRQLLQSGLRKALETKGLDEIVVQDITDAATVNRGTFYDHYRDKYALFDSMVAHDFHLLLEARNIRFDGTCAGGLTAIVLAVCDYLEQVHLGSNRSCENNALVPFTDAAITAALRRVFLTGFAGRSELPLPGEMIAGMVSWAIFGAVKEWFQKADRVSKDTIVPAIVELLLPILHTAP